ncbi:MAG: cytochrome b/b6 domain-containing protein [Marmoricola sp.]
MGARNGEHGYGWVTKTLHWLTAGVVLAQFVVGYLMDDEGGQGRGRGRGRGEGSGHGRGRGGEEDVVTLLPLHVTLGVTILVIAIIRVSWRVSTPLPPWAESLSVAERRIATFSERTLLTMLFVVPATGLVLVLGEEDDLLGVHVAAQIAFFTALAAHLGLVLGRGLRGRPVLLRRML